MFVAVQCKHNPDDEMIQVQTTKYKLKPTKAQAEMFEQWLGTCRFVYNLGLELKIYAWQQRKKSISKFELVKALPELKKEADWIESVPSQTLQAVMERLDRSYQNFFKQGFGFPKFAKKDLYTSFLLKQGLSIAGNQIKLPKIGKVRFFNSKAITGKIKNATVKKEANGWHICVVHESEVIPKKIGFGKIGVDLGIKYFAVTSKEQYIEHPKVFLHYQATLRRLNRKLARAKRGSRNRSKVKQQLSKLHLKIKQSRQDFLHKQSTELVNENQVIALEDLNVQGMVRNKHLSKYIADSGWGEFGRMMEYKTKWQEKVLEWKAPQYTSQSCSECGYTHKDNRKSQSLFLCQRCGYQDNADFNASKNICGSGRTAGTQRKAVA